jgi:hypothetical protein
MQKAVIGKLNIAEYFEFVYLLTLNLQLIKL